MKPRLRGGQRDVAARSVVDLAIPITAAELPPARNLAFKDRHEGLGIDRTGQPERRSSLTRSGTRLAVREIVRGVSRRARSRSRPAMAPRSCRSTLPSLTASDARNLHVHDMISCREHGGSKHRLQPVRSPEENTVNLLLLVGPLCECRGSRRFRILAGSRVTKHSGGSGCCLLARHLGFRLPSHPYHPLPGSLNTRC